jgi:DNA-binding NtrC family response regulator
MFGELQSIANLAKYPANAPADLPPRATARISSEKRLERFGLLYGACQPMRDLFHGLDRLSRSTAPVMILGESGSGKELVATTLHHLSPRKDRPFIAVNCGAIPETLIESELFGHERGSFTGAARTHRGCFERADGGTLFLDEVTEMPVEMQVRLLRVLETGRFTRVGGDQEIGADVRVLAASNRDLRQAVASGKLREDLMYRLCVIPVNVPPLRDRGDDAVLLAEMFLSELNEEQGEQKTLSADGRRRIVEHTWPGNVRELKNAVERAVIMARGSTIGPTDIIPRHLRSGGELPATVTITVGSTAAEARQQLVLRTFASTSGDASRTGKMLGISEGEVRGELIALLERRTAGESNGSSTPDGTDSRGLAKKTPAALPKAAPKKPLKKGR